MNSNNDEPIACNYCPKILTKLNEVNRARHIEACEEKSCTPKS